MRQTPLVGSAKNKTDEKINCSVAPPSPPLQITHTRKYIGEIREHLPPNLNFASSTMNQPNLTERPALLLLVPSYLSLSATKAKTNHHNADYAPSPFVSSQASPCPLLLTRVAWVSLSAHLYHRTSPIAPLAANALRYMPCHALKTKKIRAFVRVAGSNIKHQTLFIFSHEGYKLYARSTCQQHGEKNAPPTNRHLHPLPPRSRGCFESYHTWTNFLTPKISPGSPLSDVLRLERQPNIDGRHGPWWKQEGLRGSRPPACRVVAREGNALLSNFRYATGVRVSTISQQLIYPVASLYGVRVIDRPRRSATPHARFGPRFATCQDCPSFLP